jgi:hypothetical protein
MPNGAKSDACARIKSKIGSGDNSIDIYSNICFDSDGRLKFYGSTGYDMEFRDYHGFGKKQFPRVFADSPESGTDLVGKVLVLEDEVKADTANLFTPLDTKEDRFSSTVVPTPQLDRLVADIPPIAWPPVRSGNTRGHLAIYISVDREGKVREAWPLTGDNGELHDLLRDQARTWQLKPAVDPTGKPIQIEGSLSFPFETHIGKPLPVVTGADVQKFLIDCPYNPTLAPGLLPRGTTFKISVSVDRDGKETGVSFRAPLVGPTALQVLEKTGLHNRNCHFKPYLEDGQPTYYSLEFTFTAP